MDDSILQELLAAKNPATKAAIVAESVLSSLPEETALVARYCVIFHWFNQEVIGALLPESTSNHQAEVYEQIKSLPFIADVPYGLTYHDLTREGLLERYSVQQPELFKNAARKAAAVYESDHNLTIAAEAFYCHTIAGNFTNAIQWRDKLLTVASVRKDWQFYNNILQVQREVERLPFVEPLERFFEYDVFISYSPINQAWVKTELLPSLEAKNLRIWVDFRNLDEGDSIVAQIERAVQTSRKMLLVLTPNYLNSVWNQLEVSVFDKLDISNRASRLIPLLKEKITFSSPLNNLNYIDFTKPDNLDIAWKQLLAALGKSTTSEAPAELPPKRWFIPYPYPTPPNFTGRKNERQILNQWLEQDTLHPLLVLRALGGFGKSALTWYWLLHDVNRQHWQQVVWWSFYESDAGFESFLRKTLEYLNGETSDVGSIPSRQQVDILLELLHQSPILLVLDGFERLLRAYGNMSAAYQGEENGQIDSRDNARDCVSPVVEHFLYSLAKLSDIQGKVLITTRLRPRILEVSSDNLLHGCQEKELQQMQPDDAVKFFRAEGVRGSRENIQQACSFYGFHPLSLRLLAGLIVQDAQQPGDIAAAARLDVSGELVQRQHHVLQQTYDSLTPECQHLLSRIACFRGSVAHETLSELAAAEENNSIDADLQDLVSRGLLQYDQPNNRYDLHPIVRRYAYDRLGSKERNTVHSQLRDYFAAVPPPEEVQSLDDLNPVIELYHHMVKAGQYDEACELFYDRINQFTYYQFGAYQLRIELLLALFPDGEEQMPRLEDEAAQAWTLSALANNYGRSGQFSKAAQLLEQEIAIWERQDSRKNLATVLGNLANNQLNMGVLQASEINLHRQITICREIEAKFNEAVGHSVLGLLLIYQGMWTKAETELATALAIFEEEENIQAQGLISAHQALRSLLLVRASALPHLAEQSPEQDTNPVATALATAQRALELANETARTVFPYARDFVEAYWLLGAAHRVNGDIVESDSHLSEALSRCRAINLVESEANILRELAQLRLATGNQAEALRLAEEALTITERCGYVLQGADVHLCLAQIALADGDRQKALFHAREARRLATCDGPPDYTYKVAYEEAGVLLAQLGEEI